MKIAFCLLMTACFVLVGCGSGNTDEKKADKAVGTAVEKAAAATNAVPK